MASSLTGCPRGGSRGRRLERRWVGALLTGRTVELLVLEDVDAALALPDVDLIAIDMPIGLSAQAWHLMASIRQVDDALGDPPSDRVVEVHPDGAPGVPLVDALDACAAAWSAQRLHEGRGECVGDGTTDSRGRPMRICW